MSVLAALRDRVRLEAEQRGVPGIALGIVYDGAVETAAYGTASADTRLPLRSDSVFRIASITKPVTATLVLVLAEEGLLSLDTPVLHGRVTLRHLLSHASGLDCELASDLTAYGSLEELLPDVGTVRRWAAPGQLWAYCNVGYWVAGAAAARACGMTFEEAVRERVLTPLGLERMTFEVADAILHPAAVGHVPVEPLATQHEVAATCYRYPPVRRPSGGLISTVEDLLAFARAHFDDRFAVMQESQIDAVGCEWGLGWRLERAGDLRLALHYGGYGGFATLLLVAPEREFALAVLTNSARGQEAIDPIADEALDRVLGVRRTRPEPVVLPEDALAELSGTYVQQHVEVRVEPAGSGLRVEIASYDVSRAVWDRQPPVDAVAVSERAFAFPATGELFDFPREGIVRIGGRLAERT